MFDAVKKAIPIRYKDWIKLRLGLSSESARQAFKAYPELLGKQFERTSQLQFEGHPFRAFGSGHFVWLYKEVFCNQLYWFNTTDTSPCIIDVGANIGMTSIYFKKLYPNAKITAFEPQPEVFSLLKHNLEYYDDIEIVNKAVLQQEGTTEFSCTAVGSSGVRSLRGDNANEHTLQSIVVKTTSLRPWLENQQRIDMLKIDTEGSEEVILRDIADLLPRVDNLTLEYHQFPGNPQGLQNILSIVHDAGLHYLIINTGYKEGMPPPFRTSIPSDLTEFSLLVICTRDAHNRKG